MKKIFLISLTLLLCVAAVQAESTPSDIRTLKHNFRCIMVPTHAAEDSLYNDFLEIEPEREMSDQVVMELHQKYPFDLAKIDSYLNRLSADGRFSDINYADTRRSGWEPKIHAERVLELTKLYYSEKGGRYKSPQLRDNIFRALGYWFREKPKCLNWWYNEIGIPKTLGAAFILLEDELSETELRDAIEVMSAARFRMTGQNKVWLAGNVLIRGLLQNDIDLIKAARDTIASEIRVGNGEGIQYDWSFHQHGPQQQFGNYGMSYILSMSFFKKLFDGTSFHFDDAQTEILTSLINEGYRWVIWKRFMDISSLGRQLFHNAQLHKGYSTAFVAEDMGVPGFAKTGNNLVGHKHFRASDFTVHRRPQWMATLKMSSERVIGTELVNEDNLNGYYLGDGATFYYVRGDEYLNVFPFWDWRKIPGVTAYAGPRELPSVRATKSRNRSRMVGGITSGDCGMSVMDIDRDGLRARKAWVFGPDFVVCMGAGISSDSTAAVTTAIDQRLRNGSLEILADGRWETIEGQRSYQGPQRFLHDATAYITLCDAPLTAKAEKRTGRWCDNMKMYRPAEVEGSVVELSLVHGARPKEGQYLYIVIPDCSKQKAEAFRAEDEVSVLRNDRTAQVISLPSVARGYWAAVYDNSVDLDLDGTVFHAETPGIYYIETSDSTSTPLASTRFD